MYTTSSAPWWGRGRRAGVLAAVTALLAALVTGLGAAGAAQAATVDTSASYVLVNRGSGKALDVAGASTAEGAALTQWTRTGGANQRFQFVESGGGYYRLKAQHSGRVLDVLNHSRADHAAIVQWSDANGTNQQFRLADSSDGYVRLLNRNSGKAVEVQNSSTADGAKVVQFTDRGGANQQWQLVRATGVLAQVHTAGRVKDAGNTVQFSWPGVYFEGRVSGTGVGIVLNDSAADYDVQIDGTTVATLVTPGNTTHWINGLSNSTHTVRLVKRNDTPWDTSAFGGFVAAPGGAVLSKPAARNRQIEFIGDSLTVGYGNLSASRTCTSDQLERNTNSDVSYGALTARQLNADYQINGYSGLGMVRNYNGGRSDVTYRTFYDRALLNVSGDVWQNPGTWRPQVVVINLGTNDFSTALNPGEPWTPESLAAGYRSAYGDFIQKLRTRYGADTAIVAVGAGQYSTHVQQVVKARNDAGDSRVRYWLLDDSGLDFLGCDWHYSARDDRLIADRLTSFIGGLPTRW
ncbi:RICIN domain-containing protein [Streptomyces sp. NBC_00124]|uniref:RICIN domain-containing protein n=1 Tax=Streptomyces sp. NBC_00124 TaxID=2975662 RepID=UPI0022597907|nr:RICIN domain-containing protein [Streptomyces sp. NBC_00124]MCX5366996.1 RICIN domain-containing protein [Streptomyces sp. NBC_00124]